MQLSRLRAQARFALGLGAFLRQRIGLDEARAHIQRRREQREPRLLELLRRAVYERPESPYRWLLERAGCSLADVETGLRQHGIEGLLLRLHAEGVYVTFDELKGRVPMVRGAEQRAVQVEDFDNPLLDTGLWATTGGSSGPPSRTQLDLEYLAERAPYDAVMFHMLRVGARPLALWYPKLPASTGISNSLRYLKVGKAPARWFHLEAERQSRPGLESELATAGVLVISRALGRPVPVPRPVRVDDPDPVVDWIEESTQRHRGCVVQAYVSQAVRMSQRAMERGLDLDGVLFIVGSEPLTEAKQRAIARSGAAVYPRYFATETGSVGFGCGAAREVGDYHLVDDTLAMIQPEGDGGPLHLTSLLSSAPKLLLNARLGDVATVERRNCGCAFGDLGFSTHLRHVRGLDVVASEAMRVRRADLARLAEEVLPARHGGTALDYQWIEHEERALTRLGLRVDPRLGPVDEQAVVRDVLEELARLDWAHRLCTQLWREAGTVRVLRERPTTSARGKHQPLLREQAADSVAARRGGPR
jgi:hypothetical protein